MATWKNNDNVFVGVGDNFNVILFDLDSYTSARELVELEITESETAKYDGPEKPIFREFLSKTGYRVNRQGRVAIAVPKKDHRGAYIEDFRYFLAEKLVRLDRYGFKNVPLDSGVIPPPKPKDAADW